VCGEGEIFIHYRDEPAVLEKLLVVGLGQWVLAGARWGGRGRSWSGGGVWGWKGPPSELEGLWE